MSTVDEEIAKKKAQLVKLNGDLRELRTSLAIVNGSTQERFTLSVSSREVTRNFNISYTDKYYHTTYRPRYEKLKAVLAGAISDEMLDVEEYIDIATKELKALYEKAASEL